MTRSDQVAPRPPRTAPAPPVDGTTTGKGQVGIPGSDATREPEAPRRGRLLTVVAVIAVALFALWGLAGPLVGTSVLASTDEMVSLGPYVDAGQSDGVTRNTWLDDTYTAAFPYTILYKKSVADGHPAQWNPYLSGGTPLGSVPNNSFFSPLSLPYFLLPTWLAPAYAKLLEIICSVGGCFLFLRRLRLSRPAAITGGLVFAGSAFMVAWLSFPQTRVASFIPALFWCLERLIQLRRVRDAALIAVPVAAMLLGGFPAVAGYALLTAACYTVVRVAARYRGWRPLLATLAGAAGGVLAGAGLAVFQLLPFAGFYPHWLIEGRGQTSHMHLSVTSLITTVAPYALGTINPGDPPEWLLPQNMVESVSYVGAAALVLAVVAVAAARRSRAALPRAVWVFLVLAALGWAELIYLGGPPLGLLQRLPGLHLLFGGNFIGRSRSVLGFLLAVLAAIGLDVLLRRGDAGIAGERPHRGYRLWAVAVWAGTGVAGLVVILHARRVTAAAAGSHLARLGRFDHQMLLGGALVALALACVYVLWRGTARTRRRWPRLRLAAAVTLPLLIAMQAGYFAHAYYPYSPRRTFYPITDSHQFLAANLGDQRVAYSDRAFVRGTTAAYQLRSVNGHAFINAAFAALIRGIPGKPIPYPTYLRFGPDPAQVTSPILDRLGTKYFATAPDEKIFGTPHRAATDGGTLVLRPDQPVTVAVPGSGPLRAVGLVPTGPVPRFTSVDKNSWLDVAIRDASGQQVAQTRRIIRKMRAGAPFLVAVTADGVAAGTHLTATLTLHSTSSLTVQATHGAPALATVSGIDDGLRLVHAGSSVIYQRQTALPRIRWAASSTVVLDQDERVRLLASGTVPADRVVLSQPGPVAAGLPGQAQIVTDGTNTITTRVSAQGAGYLVVADADQVGWAATVDGHPARLVPADQGLVAVAVPAGEHTVRLHVSTPHARVATGISGTVAVVLVLAVLGEVWWAYRRRRAGHDRDDPDPDAPSDPVSRPAAPASEATR
jgi:hypothetical protein